jgi:hypothetical protein
MAGPPDHGQSNERPTEARIEDRLDVVDIDLPVGERLRTWADPGDVGVDAVGCRCDGIAPRALGAASRFVFLLRDARLFALALCNGRP